MRTACLCLVTLLYACGGAPAANLPPPSPEALALRRMATELLQRPPIEADEVTVQHCLIATRGSGAISDKPSLTHAQAEQRAAVLLTQALAGADFNRLVLENTYDDISSAEEPGVFVLLQPTAPPGERPLLDVSTGRFWRDQMVPAFGEAAWRLKVGEIGVIEKSKTDSPYGYHIIKRLR